MAEFGDSIDQSGKLSRRDFLRTSGIAAATPSVFCLFETSLADSAKALTPEEEVADAIYWNGNIYPMASPGVPLRPEEAIAVKGERIIFVGDKEEAATFVGDKTKRIDLQGGSVYPGFTDAHTHPLDGLISFKCDLAEAKDSNDVLAMLRKYVAEHKDLPWILGAVLQPSAALGSPPPVETLDKIITDKPIYIEFATGHSSWVNSKALELAGISSKTPDPKEGTIGRKPNSDEPSGYLLEPPAMDLVRNIIPPFSRAENMAALKYSIRLFNSFGVTNLVEAKAGQIEVDALLDLLDEGGLTAHLRCALFADITKGETCVADVFALKRQIELSGKLTPDITLDQVKLFIDGTVEEKTAAMQWDFSNGDPKGKPWTDAKTLNRVVAEFDKAGMQIHVHSIGDLGTKMVLDAFEYARKQNGIRDSRHQICHLHVVDPKDIERFHELGVTANFQAVWASGDDDYVTKMNPALLAGERLNWQYPIGAMVRSGASVVFGSDWSVTTLDPLPAMQVAVTRRGPDTVPKEPWMPEQLIDVPTVVDGYTRQGAWSTFREKEIGTLEKGKLADLVVLNGDLFAGSKFDLIKKKVKMTVFRGKVVYEAD